MNKIAVYTCITGNYDNLLEISEKSDKIDYICFTDNKNLKSASWKIKYFSEIDGFGILKNEITNVKKQRLIKILSHKFLSEYDTTLWVDANIKIQHNLYNFITSFDLEKCPIYTNKHPTRNCLYQEVLAVVKLKKDKYENIRPQVLRYKSEKYPVNNGMAETNIILRNNKDLRNHLLELKWAKEILQGSHRDQLSFNYVIWKNKLSYSHLNIQYRFTKENDLFHLVKHNKSTLPYSQDFIKSSSGIQQEKNDENSSQDLIYKQINNFKFKKTSSELPILNVIMTTHNRTGVACYCIDALVKNLKYSGKIQYIICDDRSEPGHCEALEYQFKQCGIFDVIILKTDEDRYGLGASLNNGLYNSFERSDIVLTTEDDWLLVKELNMDLYVKTIIENKEIGGIRLATSSYNGRELKDFDSSFYKFIYNSSIKILNNNYWIFNNQVMLRHKRVYDKLGYYKENCHADEQEREFCIKFNNFTNFGENYFKVLYPRCLNLKSELFGDKNYFHHIGITTMPGNNRKNRPLKNEYLEINSNDYTKKLQNRFTNLNTKLYNNEKTIISLTSWKKRIHSVHLTIKSLLEQCKDSHIVLVLSEEEFPHKFFNLPTSLLDLLDKIEILWVYKNYKSFKKILFTMNKYKDIPVISVDDDFIYKFDIATDLYNIWLNNKSAVIGYCDGKKTSTHPWGYATLHPPNAYEDLGLKCLDVIYQRECHHDDWFLIALRKKLGINEIVLYDKSYNNINYFDKNTEIDRKFDLVHIRKTKPETIEMYTEILDQIIMENDFQKIHFYALNRNNNLFENASSAGVIPEVVNYLINTKNAVVYGASYTEDFYGVYHKRVDNIEDYKKYLMGSKYVESNINGIFIKVENDLKDNKFVCFIGTPCQISALKKYLNNKDTYKKLFTISIICNSYIPTDIFKNYIIEKENEFNSKVCNINMRDKTYEWKNYSLKIEFENGKVFIENHKTNNFLQNYLKHKHVLNRCKQCKYSFPHESDITVGDWWGAVKDVDFLNKNGSSIIAINTILGNKVFENIKNNFTIKEVDYQTANIYNSFRFKTAGIMTHFENKNFGQKLQAFAVQYILRNRYKIFSTIYTTGGANRNININTKIQTFVDKYFIINSAKKIENAKDDILIVGSDQVWNELDYKFNHDFLKNYLLEFSQTPNKFAFAASISDQSKIINKNLFKNALSKFKGISVRERKSVNELKSIGIESNFILDPVALLTINELNNISNKPDNIIDNSEFYYQYKLRKDSKIEFSSPFKNTICNNFKDNDGPSEFIWYIKHAKCVYTDSFHAMLISLKFNTNVKYIGTKNDFESKSRFNIFTELGYDFNADTQNWSLINNNFEKLINESFTVLDNFFKNI
jgi:coenzyme F420-reducing hydrogenase beta subunit